MDLYKCVLKDNNRTMATDEYDSTERSLVGVLRRWQRGYSEPSYLLISKILKYDSLRVDN